MAIETPVVRYFLACREIEMEKATGDTTLHHLIHAIVPLPGEHFPLQQTEFALFGLLSGGRGQHAISIEFTRFEMGEEVSISAPPARVVDFGQDPMRVIGLPMDVNQVEFEASGQYAFHLLCDGHRLATVDILVRDET